MTALTSPRVKAPEVYDRGMAQLARNAAAIYTGEVAGPPPHSYSTLEDVFTIQATPRRARLMREVFLGWYSKVSGLLLGGLMLETELRKNPQLFVAGQLSEFADIVETICGVADVLWDAGQLVRTHGWVQRETGDLQRGLSLEAAVSVALARHCRKDRWAGNHDEALWRGSVGTVREYLQTSLLAEWNDTFGRTIGEVIWLLEWCAIDIRIIK